MESLEMITPPKILKQVITMAKRKTFSTSTTLKK